LNLHHQKNRSAKRWSDDRINIEMKRKESNPSKKQAGGIECVAKGCTIIKRATHNTPIWKIEKRLKKVQSGLSRRTEST